MESRIKTLREKRGIIQEILAAELGITQQMLSKYENDVTVIKVDILKRLAEYFNVTTDYLLGMSDVKRDLTGQIKLNETLDEYYDMIEVYKKLDQYDQELVWSLLQIVRKNEEKKKKDRENRNHVAKHSKKEFYTNRYGCLLGRRTFGCFGGNGEFF